MHEGPPQHTPDHDALHACIVFHMLQLYIIYCMQMFVRDSLLGPMQESVPDVETLCEELLAKVRWICHVVVV